MGVYSNTSNREKAKLCNHITKVSITKYKTRILLKMGHYLKRLNVFGKLNHMEPFQSWIQTYCLLLNNRPYKY